MQKASAQLYTWHHRALVFAIGFVLLMVLLYGYFLSASVMHVVQRSETHESVRVLHAEMAALETVYIDRQHEISATIVSLDGYEEPIGKLFIDRSAVSLAILRNQ